MAYNRDVRLRRVMDLSAKLGGRRVAAPRSAPRSVAARPANGIVVISSVHRSGILVLLVSISAGAPMILFKTGAPSCCPNRNICPSRSTWSLPFLVILAAIDSFIRPKYFNTCSCLNRCSCPKQELLLLSRTGAWEVLLVLLLLLFKQNASAGAQEHRNSGRSLLIKDYF